MPVLTGLSQSLNTDQGNSAKFCATLERWPGRRSLNPSIQIRAIRTLGGWLRKQGVAIVSQSLKTDQGNSDSLYVLWPAALIIFVSIPQYRSGQFGQRALQGLEDKGVKWPVFPASPKSSFSRLAGL